MTHGHLAAGTEQGVEAVDQDQVVECRVDLSRRKDPHGSGPRAPGVVESSEATSALWRSIAFWSRGSSRPGEAGEGAAAV